MGCINDTTKLHGNQIQDIPQTGFFGHPRGLGVLFFVEFWERFSYYGMRALLIFYMYFAVTDNGLGIDKNNSYVNYVSLWFINLYDINTRRMDC